MVLYFLLKFFETTFIMTFLDSTHGLGFHSPGIPRGMWAVIIKSKKLNTTVTHDGKMRVFVVK